MALNPGDLLFVGWDSDNEDIAFIATTDIPAGEVIYFTDDEWNGTEFNTNEQLMEWTEPAGGLPLGTVVNIDMSKSNPRGVTFDSGGTVDYIRGGYDIATRDEMFWAFQGTRSGDDVTPTNFVAVISNEADGNFNRSPELSGTGLTTSNGAIIIDGDEDFMEWTGDANPPDPLTSESLKASILDTSTWRTADGVGNSNPNTGSVGFDFQPVVCFLAGTRIATPDGAVPVEAIDVGQQVTLHNGRTAVVRWLGRRSVGDAELARFPKLHPVRISAGALGGGLPERDLWVSRQHRVLVSSPIAKRMFGVRDVLVPAIALTRLPGIEVDASRPTLRYFHLLCDDHEVVLAEGAPAETLYLGAETLKALTPEGRREIAALFPDLGARAFAAPVPDRARGRQLIARHRRNDKDLLARA